MRSAFKVLCAASMMIGVTLAAPQAANAQSTHRAMQQRYNHQVATRYSRIYSVLCEDGMWTRKGANCLDHGGVAARQYTPRASAEAVLHANEHSAVARAYANGTRTSAIARCTDGTYWHASTRRGACYDHGGVRRWL
jgi:hypothetical protein